MWTEKCMQESVALYSILCKLQGNNSNKRDLLWYRKWRLSRTQNYMYNLITAVFHVLMLRLWKKTKLKGFALVE